MKALAILGGVVVAILMSPILILVAPFVALICYTAEADWRQRDRAL